MHCLPPLAGPAAAARTSALSRGVARDPSAICLSTKKRIRVSGGRMATGRQVVAPAKPGKRCASGPAIVQSGERKAAWAGVPE
jgi:hypothetical protein